MLANVEGGYPVSLVGELDPNLSRWLWLVKWLLALPHFAILCQFLDCPLKRQQT